MWQDGKTSEARKKIVKSMKKELGLAPYGDLPSYSATFLPDEVAKLPNEREKESLDIQWAIPQVSQIEFCWDGLL